MGAGVVRVKGTSRALALSTDGNGRYGYLDPRRGAMLAVAEAARNVACAGGVPIGATNCLNFGNPQRPEIMWQLVEAIEGIAEACLALDVPITGGNVSLYNETDGKAIYPTPTIGVVGLIEDASQALGRTFRGAGDAIVLLGDNLGELGGSEYLKVVHGLVRGVPPALDLTARAGADHAADDGGGARPDQVGARLRRRRAGGDARPNARSTPRASASTSTCRRRRRATRHRPSASPRRSSASRPHASSSASREAERTAFLQLAAERGVPAAGRRDRRVARGSPSPVAGSPAMDVPLDEAEAVWSGYARRAISPDMGDGRAA